MFVNPGGKSVSEENSAKAVQMPWGEMTMMKDLPKQEFVYHHTLSFILKAYIASQEMQMR